MGSHLLNPSPNVSMATAQAAAQFASTGIVAILALALSGLIVALFLIVYLARKQRYDRRCSAGALRDLGDALNQVDLFGASKPKLEFQPNGQLGGVSESINDLLQRVELYKSRLHARERRMRRLLSNVSDVMFQTDANLQVTWVTDSVERVLGYPVDEIRGRSMHEFLIDGEQSTLEFHGHTQISNVPIRAYCRDGSVAWLLVTARRLQDADGEFCGAEGFFRDGTDLVEAEQTLFNERNRAQVTLASIGDSVITTTIDGVVDYMNPRAEALVGETHSSAKGRHFDEVCHLLDNKTREPIKRLVDNCINTKKDIRLLSDTILHDWSHQRDFSVRVSVSPIRDSHSKVSGTVVVLHDITELHEISRQMTYQATHDSLTGLANRQVFEKRVCDLLENTCAGSRIDALCYLDLDQFKVVNDTCGHSAGDELLRQIARQLADQIRDGDSIARLGGDEFGVLLHDTTIESATSTAERMCQCVEDFRFNWDNKLFRLGVSIGLVPITPCSGDFADVLSNADAACYIAKDNGRNRVHVHLPDDNEVANRHSDMARLQDLTEAIDRNGFALFAQVIRAIDWEPGDPIGLECLVRLRTAEGELLAPAAFLPIAERYQIMSRIDRWVFEHALDLIIDSAYPKSQIQFFSVNLSAQSVTDDHFIDFAFSQLNRAGVEPERFMFEITETSAVTNFGRAARLINGLRSMGCRFALDDFGSGLSSFSYLKNLPLDVIKIDGAFVRDILSDPVDLETVKAINQVCHTMGLKTIAEFVESEEILEKLRMIGVDYVQGYHIKRPVPLEELLDSTYFQ